MKRGEDSPSRASRTRTSKPLALLIAILLGVAACDGYQTPESRAAEAAERRAAAFTLCYLQAASPARDSAYAAEEPRAYRRALERHVAAGDYSYHGGILGGVGLVALALGLATQRSVSGRLRRRGYLAHVKYFPLLLVVGSVAACAPDPRFALTEAEGCAEGRIQGRVDGTAEGIREATEAAAVRAAATADRGLIASIYLLPAALFLLAGGALGAGVQRVSLELAGGGRVSERWLEWWLHGIDRMPGYDQWKKDRAALRRCHEEDRRAEIRRREEEREADSRRIAAAYSQIDRDLGLAPVARPAGVMMGPRGLATRSALRRRKTRKRRGTGDLPA